MNVHLITGICFALFWVYWFLSASSVKPIRETKGWLSGNWYSVLLFVGFAVAVDFRFLGAFGFPVALLARPVISVTPPIAVLSVVLSIAGIVIAVVARRTIGRNWSGAVALKEGHELVMVGPYHYVRHPIYTGILIMALGLALSYGTLGAGVGLAIVLFAILLKLRDEESLLSEHFPVDYPEYKKHTKRLVPFLW